LLQRLWRHLDAAASAGDYIYHPQRSLIDALESWIRDVRQRAGRRDRRLREAMQREIDARPHRRTRLHYMLGSPSLSLDRQSFSETLAKHHTENYRRKRLHRPAK